MLRRPSGRGFGKSLDQREGVRHQIALVVPPKRPLTSDAGRQFDLDSSIAREVDRVVVVESAEAHRDLLEVGDHAVAGEPMLDMSADVVSEIPIASPEEERREHAASSEAVHGHDDVDMVDEGAQVGGLGGREPSGWDVGGILVSVEDPVIGGAGPLGRRARYPIGGDLEPASVEGHEPERRPQFDLLHRPALGEQRGEPSGHDPMLARRGRCRSIEMMLVWMDLEMTGLDHTTDVIVEIATLITDDELEIVAEGPDLVVHQSDEVLAAMNEVVTGMHTASGLLEEIRSSTLGLKEAGQITLDFIREHCPEPGTVPLCGNSIGTDRRFLAAYLPEIEGHLHYRSVDVSSIKELARRWSPEVLQQAVRKPNSHRALDDIRASVDELRLYRDLLFRDAGELASAIAARTIDSPA